MAVSMSHQHVTITEGLKLALDDFRTALDVPNLASLQNFARSTSLDLANFFRQRDDTANPSLNLTAKLSPIKMVLDLTYKAACETYGFEEATAQQLYGCLQCALMAGHNIHQDMSKIVELLDQTGWFLRLTFTGQEQMQMSEQLWDCLCFISAQITILCTAYISQGLPTAEKRAYSMTWNLIRDVLKEYNTKQSQALLKSAESYTSSSIPPWYSSTQVEFMERLYKAQARQQFQEMHALEEQAHTITEIFECNECRRSFGSQMALNQHLDSPAHVFQCDACGRSFRSQDALNRHLDSPAHRFDCNDCERSFKSQDALNQHLDSSAHQFDCNDCERSFRSQIALNQHLDSSAHQFDCNNCERSFRSQDALNQHLRSPVHAHSRGRYTKSARTLVYG